MESSVVIRPSRAAWATLSVTTFGTFATFGGAASVNVALPAATRDLGADAGSTQWVVLSYLLVVSVGIPIWARIADLAERRTLYLAGLLLIALASAACVIAPSVEVLIGLRCLQAVGAAAIIANAIALLGDAFPPARLSLALGLNVASASAATALGPLLGGLIVENLGWRWVFWLTFAFALIGWAWGLGSLQGRQSISQRQSFDLPGAALITVALGTLVLGTSLHQWWLLVLALAFGTAFVLVERGSASPLIDLRLLTTKYIVFALIATATLTGMIQGLGVILAIALQTEFGYSALDAGAVLVPMSVGMMVMAPISGIAAARISVRTLASTGMSIALIAAAGLAVVIANDASPIAVAICTLGVGVGAGLFQSPNTTALISGISLARRGTANGLRATVQNTAAVLVSAIVLGLNAMEVALGVILIALLPLALLGVIASLARGTAPVLHLNHSSRHVATTLEEKR